MKPYSIQKKSLYYLLGILFMVVVSFSFLILYSLYGSFREVQEKNLDTLSIYRQELSSGMNSMQTFLQETVSSDYDFQKIANPHTSALDRVLSEQNLIATMKRSVIPYGAIFIFDQEGKVSLSTFGSDYQSPSIPEQTALKDTLKTNLRTAPDTAFLHWTSYLDDTWSLLTNTYAFRDMYVCAIIDLNRFTQHWNNSAEEASGKVIGFCETSFLSNPDISGNKEPDLTMFLSPAGFSKALFSGFLIQTISIETADISLGYFMPAENLWRYFRLSLFLFLFICVIINLLILFVFQELKKILIYPVRQISHAAECLAAGDLPGFSEKTESAAVEFQQIHASLNQLLSQKVTLEEENRQKLFRMEHAQLQYYQLQTRSHFFLNSLKSLYGMLESQEYDQMKLMILAFSNHLRFIFQDNLSLIPLRSELEEVNDYYRIIQNDRSTPIFLLQQVDPKLNECLVPPLLIQTFLENSIKYNGRSGKPLQFLIRADEIDLEGTPYIRIRISDNGIGYQEDLLEKLNCMDENLYEKDHVGINNLKRRIHLIFGEQCQLAFFNDSNGGACALLCLPIRKDLQESEEKL